MLEGALERLLLQFLDPYVEGISRDKLHLGVLSGSLELKDLRIREDGLARMGLEGFRVRTGYIKLITLMVPWGRLYTGKVRAAMQGVYMEIEQIASDVDEGTIETIVQELRQGKKGAIELRVNQLRELVLEQARNEDEAAIIEKKSYGVRLFRKILNNINVDLTDVKVYFMNQRRGLACGAELTDLSVVSTDETFRPPKSGEEVVVTGLSMYKQIRLHGLGVRMAPAGDSSVDKAEYILSPISATLQLAHVPSQQILRIRLEVATEELAEISLRRSQVKHLRGVQDLGKTQQQRIFDYMVPPADMRQICEDPAAAKNEYGKLYERKLCSDLQQGPATVEEEAQPLTENEQRQLQLLEDALSVRLLAKQRWLVQKRIMDRSEELARQEQLAREKVQQEKANAGFFGRLLGRGRTAETQVLTAATEGDDWLKPEELVQLREDIDDESKIEAVDMPQRLQFEFELGRVALDLVDDRWQDEVHRQLMSIALTEVNWTVNVELKTDYTGRDSAEWAIEVWLRDFQALHCAKDMFRFAMPGYTDVDGETFWDADEPSGCGPAAKLKIENTLKENMNLLSICFVFAPLIMHWLPGTLEHLLEFQRTPPGPGKKEALVKVSDRQVTLEEVADVLDTHGERAKEIVQKVYERIPDRVYLDISIASPIIHVPVPALGEIMLDLGKLEVVTPEPCEYSKIELAFNFNNTKLRATSLMGECYDVVRPVPINLLINYRSTESENAVTVRLSVDEITFNLAPQALRMLLSMPWAIYDIMKEKEQPKLVEAIADVPGMESDKASQAVAPSTSVPEEQPPKGADWSRGYEAAVSALVESKTIEKMKERVEKARSKQFRLDMTMEWKALDITLSDSTIPVMRLRTELLQPGLKLYFQSIPHLMTLEIRRGTLEIEHLNPRNGAWEPLAERFGLSLTILRQHTGDDGRSTRAEIEGTDPLNINLAPTAMRRAGWIFPLFFQNLTFTPPEEPSTGQQKRDDSVKYRAINLTDNAIELEFRSRYKGGLISRIPPTGSEWVALDDYILPNFVESLVARLPGSSDSSGALSLERLGVVSIPSSGAVAELLAPSPSHRLLLLASPLRVHNQTDLNLLIRFHDAAAKEVLPVDLPPQTACDAALLGVSLPEYIVQSQYGERDSCQPMVRPSEHCLLLTPNALCAVPAPALVRQGGAGVNYSHTYLSARPASLEVAFSEATKAGNTESGIISPCVMKCASANNVAGSGEAGFFKTEEIHFICESRIAAVNMPASMGLTTIALQPTLAFMNALPIGNLTVSYAQRHDAAATVASSRRIPQLRGREARVPCFSCLNLYNLPGLLQTGLRVAAKLEDGATFSEFVDFSASAFSENDLRSIAVDQVKGQARAAVNVEAISGYRVRFSCPTWFIDRSDIESPYSFKLKSKGGYYLPTDQGITLLPADAGEEGCMFCLEGGGKTVATQLMRMPPNWSIFPWKTGKMPYVLCLQSEDVAAPDVMGTDCQVITLRPRLVITNSSDSEIELQTDAGGAPSTLQPSKSIALHWPVKSGDEDSPSTELQFRPKTTPPCKFAKIVCSDITAGTTPMTIVQEPVRGSRSQNYAIQVWTAEIAPKRGALAVSLRRGSDCIAANRATKAKVTVEILPHGSEQGIAPIPVEHGSEVPFGWSDPFGKNSRKRAVEVYVNGNRYTIDDVRCRGQKACKKPECVIDVHRAGHKTFISVEDIDLPQGFGGRGQHGGSQLELKIKLDRLGLSLISELPKPSEIMYLNLDLLCLEWVRSPGDLQEIKMVISDAQIDCQLAGRVDAQSAESTKERSLPAVILANRAASGSKHFLDLTLQRGATSSSDLIFPMVQIEMDSLDVSIDEGWIDPLRSFFRELSGTDTRGGVPYSQIRRMAGKSILFEYSAPPLPSIVQVDSLKIAEVVLTVWCALKLKSAQFLPAYVRTAIGVMSFSGDFTLDGATLILNEHHITGHRGSFSDFIRCLGSEYTMNILRHTGTVLGKSSVLNLPRMPLKFGGGAMAYLSSGTGMVAGEISNFVAKLTLDEKYVEKQSMLRQTKNITNISDGMVEAGRSLGEGIEGIADVWRKPMEGAKEGGALGFMAGVGKGLTGAFVKPVTKFGAAMSDIGSGVAAQVTPESMSNKRQKARTRQRLPRLLFSHLGVIRPWSAFEAELQKELGPQVLAGIEEVVPLAAQGGDGKATCAVLLLYPNRVAIKNLNNISLDALSAIIDASQLSPSNRTSTGSAGKLGSGGGSSSSTAKPAETSIFDAAEDAVERMTDHAMKPLAALWSTEGVLGSASAGTVAKIAPAKKKDEWEFLLKGLRKVTLDSATVVTLEDQRSRFPLSFSRVPGGIEKSTLEALVTGFKSALAHPDSIANWEELQSALRAERRERSDVRRRASAAESDTLGPRSSSSTGHGIQEVFEVERRMIPAGDWKSPFLPVDTESCWRWVDSNGYRHPHLRQNLTQRESADSRKPPLGLHGLFKQKSDWQVEKGANTDKDGWKYSVAWNSSTWEANPGIFDAVRKRRWYRTYA